MCTQQPKAMRRRNDHQTREFGFCTAQMANWRPFGAAAGEEGEVISRESEGKPHQMARCNSAVATLYAELTDALLRVQIGERSASCPSLSPLPVEEEQACGKFLGGSAGHFSGVSSFSMEKELEPSVAKCHSTPIPTEDRWNVFSGSMCAFAPGEHGGRKRVGSWSKRRKQISHVFLRGLWRWKEGAHARKRRKRTAVGSCSGSGARSCYASDPPTVRGASTGYAKSVTGTDSSGELFFGFPGTTQMTWSTDFSSTIMDSSFVRDSGAGDYLTCWRSSHSDTQSTESGYTSEPDYSADSEFKCKDDYPADEEEDEDEKEPLHLLVWKETTASRGGGGGARGNSKVSQDCVVELFYGKDSRIRKMHSQIRQRRRSWRTIELCKSR